MRLFPLDLGNRVVASDPGLTRLSTAGRAVFAVGTVLLVEYGVSLLTGQQALIGMLLGAVLSMMGSMGLNTPTVVSRLKTLAWYPLAVLVGMLLGTFAARVRIVELIGFVVVIYAAVQVRRLGPAFFIYGFQAWMGYFFASFLGASVGELGYFLVDLVVAGAWLAVLTVLLPPRPQRQFSRTVQAFRARVRAAVGASTRLLSPDVSHRDRRRVRGALTGVTESALIAEAVMDQTGGFDDARAERLRAVLVDTELVAGHVAAAVYEFAQSGASPALRARAAGVVRACAAASAGGVATASDDLLRATDDGASPAVRAAAKRLAKSAGDLVGLLTAELPGARPEDSDSDTSFEPAVTLFGGNLPGAAPLARRMVAERPAARWNLLARMDLTSRQALQVALSVAVAIVAGDALSAQRYYWAVIAAFVVFTGTTTVADTVVKATNRVMGTVVGLVAAIALADATAGHTYAALAVILGSLFLGFYLLRVSYGLMIFFITIMVGQLYALLHEFSDGLLVLRLEETAIGAAAGIAVALLVLPIKVSDTYEAARTDLVGALADLLRNSASRLRSPRFDLAADADARAVDAKLQQLISVASPLARPLLFGSDGGRMGRRIALWTACAFHARALARSTRRPVPAPAELAAYCDRLADACSSISERAEVTLPAVAQVLSAPDDLPEDVRAVEHHVRHIAEVLGQVQGVRPPRADQPTGSDPERARRQSEARLAG